VRAVLEVLAVPEVPALVFWALQASFERAGRHGGAGHLGLQWYPAHPASTAVNWGGYDASGVELTGSASALPSATGNVNTRDFAWSPGVGYELRIARASSSTNPSSSTTGLTAWRGSITDTRDASVVVVRDLFAAGDTLAAPVVWSEVFAGCDEPGGIVRWSDLELVDEGGNEARVTRVAVNYQALADGGCATTDVSVDDRGGAVQATHTARRTRQGQLLELAPDSSERS
jgi:hypothetical protein